MGIANEIEFENDICNYLSTHGWLYSKNDQGYDRELALFPEDAVSWIEETQPEVWSKFAAAHGSSAQAEILSRIAKILETEGTLSLLRNGFKATGAGSNTFQMAQFKPAFGFNDKIAGKYNAMRLRVVRQLHYSTSNEKCIDLVLFLNGLPIATIELKTDFTQAIGDAKAQYKQDRLPKDAVTKKEEPLLKFKRGALVHFAVSTEEVWMTTKLSGGDTYFLPFNVGNEGRKGNPKNSNGYDTAYLWERIFDRDTWLRIIGSFIEIETKTVVNSNGGKTTKENIIFPRYHQFDAVTKLVNAARTEGAGHRYLLQHSAGSGKSNTIGWTAHQFSTLHDENDKKVFDSTIVITDRTVLDEQLKDTIKQFQSTPGVVVSIDSAQGSKSDNLATALENKAMIIVVTLQTFPFIVKEIGESAGLAGKKFAVIIDEAHSSQSGSAARKLRGVLGAAGQEEDDDEITVEDLLIAETISRKLPPNASFIAFTATPKSKTLEVFGRPPDPSKPAGKDNLPQPFHLYTMRQAIDEEFILDVLRNYLPYRVAYKLAHNGKDWDDKVVEKSEGMKALARWVRLHPYNISQRVEVIVEHFRNNVVPLLDGKAKAMVVTSSRQEAVRYKLAMDKYIANCGYPNLATLVAFSGDVEDLESGPDKFNEGSMNASLKGRNIREAFNSDDYQVLIVANKFQTGFDQPLLVAMYVDKRLDGISAVQTLSRLNRTYPGKEKTFVLDFVNDTETIRKAFEPYYETTELLATTDPNLIYDLQSKLSAEGIYTDQEASNVAEIYLKYGQDKRSQSQKELIAALSAPVDRFKKRWLQAEDDKDKEALNKLTIFHKNLGAFCRFYDFLSQIVAYEDITLETLYIFYKHLEPLVRPDRIRQKIDLSEIVLTHHKINYGGNTEITLGLAAAEEKKLWPATEVGTKTARDPEKIKLDELVQRLNDLFNDGSLTEADTVGMFNHVASKMLESDELTKQALANSKDQFKQSPTIQKVGVEASVSAMDNYQTMSKKLFQDKARMDQFLALLADHVYNKINQIKSLGP
jgi:type I restriction enzyme R subunit